MRKIYLDHSATTPLDPAVLAAMLPYLSGVHGNPSSVHAFGREARHALEEARQSIASSIGAAPEEIVFTSGGTESDNTALWGSIQANRHGGRDHLVTSAIEHHAVLEQAHALSKEGIPVDRVPVDGTGRVDPAQIQKSIRSSTALVSIMHANNEIGTIEPIAEIGAIARDRGIVFHTDAVQTVGHIPINVDDLRVDFLSSSAHKFYGPKGVGFLYARKGVKFTPLMDGGDQEKRRRAGTHNTPGIVGMAAAAEIAHQELKEEAARESALRDRLIESIAGSIEDTRLNGPKTNRLPNNSNVSIEYVEGESLLLSLDMEGIAASTGSACTSSTLEASHVLLAIGLPHETAHGSLRFSIGRWTTADEIGRLLEVLPGIVERLRAMSPLYSGRRKNGTV